MKLSVIVPCYNEAKSLPHFYDELLTIFTLKDMDFELIFVNDGSTDNTLEILQSFKHKHPEVIIIDFSRNFGKESGILAGLRETTGERVVLMDADLQDPPQLIPDMLKIMDENACDSVATRRVNRVGEPPIRSFFARQFYKIINRISDVEIVDGARDYRMMSRTMVNAILQLSEYHRFSKGIFVWVGFKTHYLEYENIERVAGETKWNFWSLLRYAFEGIIAFTTAPLRLTIFVGLFVSFSSLVYMFYVIIKAMLYGDPVAGYPSMMTIILFLGGIQLLGIGVLGEYLSKVYMEVKHRPNYIIKRKY